ncbi:MAG TPA: DUF2182 domain-containing protein [Candidatus Limnocylindria bacterium]|nr:DUF2182 domain-containing protein [Candidatus Limnocylindria bacterium]
MSDAPGAFLGTWTLMMAAMMLPSAAPMIRLHRLQDAPGAARELRSAVFVAGYLLVWAAVGVAVWLAGLLADALVPMETQAAGVAALLVAAGVYEYTPLKSVCLRACRSPMDFLVTHWHTGLAGALRVGVAHGVYCLGCCWALMAVFVGVGAMDLGWAAAIALVVLVEKVLPVGVAFSRVVGAVLIAAGLAILARPELAMLLPRM